MLEVGCNIVAIRESGKILVIRVENEDKRVIMSNKHKFKGDKVFRENDLSWEKKKLQKKNEQVGEETKKGKKVKVELERVRMEYGKDGQSQKRRRKGTKRKRKMQKV